MNSCWTKICLNVQYEWNYGQPGPHALLVMYKAVHETLKGTWQNDSKLKELVSRGMNASPQARTVVVTETYRSQSYAILVAAGILSGPTATVGIIDTDGQKNWLPGDGAWSYGGFIHDEFYTPLCRLKTVYQYPEDVFSRGYDC